GQPQRHRLPAVDPAIERERTCRGRRGAAGNDPHPQSHSQREASEHHLRDHPRQTPGNGLAGRLAGPAGQAGKYLHRRCARPFGASRRVGESAPRVMRRRDWLDVAIVAGVAALTNFTYCALSNGDFFFPDSFTYLRPAQNILRGVGFFAEPDAVETMRTPGYPLLLAAFGTKTFPVIVLQHLLNVALCAGVYLVARGRVSRF